MSDLELKEQLRAIVAEVSEVDVVPDDVAFKELGIDSMMAVEIIAAVERGFRLTVSEEELPQLTNFAEVYRLVQRKLAHSEPRAAATAA